LGLGNLRSHWAQCMRISAPRHRFPLLGWWAALVGNWLSGGAGSTCPWCHGEAELWAATARLSSTTGGLLADTASTGPPTVEWQDVSERRAGPSYKAVTARALCSNRARTSKVRRPQFSSSVSATFSESEGAIAEWCRRTWPPIRRSQWGETWLGNGGGGLVYHAAAEGWAALVLTLRQDRHVQRGQRGAEVQRLDARPSMTTRTE